MTHIYKLKKKKKKTLFFAGWLQLNKIFLSMFHALELLHLHIASKENGKSKEMQREI